MAGVRHEAQGPRRGTRVRRGIRPGRAGTDGSWGGTVTFNFTGVTLKSSTLNATCEYNSGATFVPYAGSNYDTHKVTLG